MPQLTNDPGRLNNWISARFPEDPFRCTPLSPAGHLGPFWPSRFRLIESGLLMCISKQYVSRSHLAHIAVILRGDLRAFEPACTHCYMPIIGWTVPAISGIIDHTGAPTAVGIRSAGSPGRPARPQPPGGTAGMRMAPTAAAHGGIWKGDNGHG